MVATTGILKRFQMIRASATSGGSELYKAIVLPLQFLLVVYHKLEIPDVIQNESVMKASLEGTKRIREEGQRTNLQFKRVLEQAFGPLSFTFSGRPQDNEDRISKSIFFELLEPVPR